MLDLAFAWVTCVQSQGDKQDDVADMCTVSAYQNAMAVSYNGSIYILYIYIYIWHIYVYIVIYIIAYIVI